MAAPKILIRRSSTPSNIPTIAQLELGELAINTYDGNLFLKKEVAGVQTVVKVGGGALTEIDGGSAVTVFTAGLFTSVDGGNA
jgi:hypothetical protein